MLWIWGIVLVYHKILMRDFGGAFFQLIFVRIQLVKLLSFLDPKNGSRRGVRGVGAAAVVPKRGGTREARKPFWGRVVG